MKTRITFLLISTSCTINLIKSWTSFPKTQNPLSKLSMSSNNDYESKLQQNKQNLKILEHLFPSSLISSDGTIKKSQSKLIPLKVLGQCEISGQAIALSLDTQIKYKKEKAVVVPIPSKVNPLLQSCYNSKNLDYKPSKTQLLSLNTLLTNVDNGLFDNLPYATWSIDNVTDATGINPIDAKYHYGKRDAYNRFLGKDWPGYSLSIGNLAQRLLVSMEKEEDEFSQESLSKRILEIQLLEYRSLLAQSEYEFAVLKDPSQQEEITRYKNLIQEMEEMKLSKDRMKGICNRLIDLNTKNPAPYRGAYGYAPYIDSSQDIKQGQPYRNPIDLLHEIITQQLNANILGCILENINLNPNVIQLGGAIVLQRKSTTKVMIEGKEYEMNEQETNVNNVTSGDLFIVECFGYEAVAVAMALGLDVFVQDEVWDKLYVDAELVDDDSIENYNNMIPIPTVTIEEETSIIYTEEVNNNILSKITTKTTSSLTPLSNPTSSTINIQSLQEYDALSIPQKAQLIQSIKPDIILPRPRTLNNNQLNDLLLPYIDETIRRQYKIRQAKQNNDPILQQLLEQKSKRQILKEQMDQTDSIDSYLNMKDEMDVYTNIRADVTQDEGEYDRYLDKDDWYERDRLRNAKRVRKGSFGTLLDGIE